MREQPLIVLRSGRTADAGQDSSSPQVLTGALGTAGVSLIMKEGCACDDLANTRRLRYRESVSESWTSLYCRHSTTSSIYICDDEVHSHRSTLSSSSPPRATRPLAFFHPFFFMKKKLVTVCTWKHVSRNNKTAQFTRFHDAHTTKTGSKLKHEFPLIFSGSCITSHLVGFIRSASCHLCRPVAIRGRHGRMKAHIGYRGDAVSVAI